jgi:hypothetical protein
LGRREVISAAVSRIPSCLRICDVFSDAMGTL